MRSAIGLIYLMPLWLLDSSMLMLPVLICLPLSTFFAILLVLWIWPFSSILMGLLLLAVSSKIVQFLMPIGRLMSRIERAFLGIVFISLTALSPGLRSNRRPSLCPPLKPNIVR